MNGRALRLVKNNRAVLLLSSKRADRWPALAKPIHASDTRNKELAVSALRGFAMLDREPVYACDLTNEQAADVAAWINR